MLTKRRLEQRRLGRRYGNRPNIPTLEKILGNAVAGSANVPPIAGPIMVPNLAD
jgi:hypothetical protein